MIAVNGSSFGRRGGALLRYPGGAENDSILRTVLRSTPNTRDASWTLILSTRHARRTRAYKSTRRLVDAHPLDTTRPPDPRVQIHSIHPPAFQSEQPGPKAIRRSLFGPPQPDGPAASVGDYCSAVLTGLALYCLGRHEEALQSFRRTVPFTNPYVELIMAAACGQLALHREAGDLIRGALKVRPGYTKADFSHDYGVMENSALEHIVEGLTKAGLA